MTETKESAFLGRLKLLKQNLNDRFEDQIKDSTLYVGDFTIEIKAEEALSIFTVLRDDKNFQFSQLIDVCGIDYSAYGKAEWQTESASVEGFGRAAKRFDELVEEKRRFAVVYHLLSVALNQRLRVKVFLENEMLALDSVCDIWPSANWFEREAFDLFGIVFTGHPDLRRILTDYGFVGHPFRKDFPLSGKVQVRYDEEKKRVVYEPVSITPRVLVPKVIRQDNRYGDGLANEGADSA
jgi:NADH-quinone oxidoreductase subunit C